MTNEEMITDLKQFIEVTVHQQLAMQLGDFRDAINEKFENIDKKFEDVVEKLDEIMTAVGESLHHQDVRLNDHDDRLRKLERTVA